MKLKFAFLLALFPGLLLSQKSDITTLFSEEAPLEIKLRFSVKEVKGITNDTIYTASEMHYKVGEKWDSIKIDIRARGNFRRKNCFYPPLRIKIKKDLAKGTIFEGNKNLKLVLPCKSPKDNALIMREYVCYQMYEPITRFTFNTRLVNIDFVDAGNKKPSNQQLLGFFIEDDDLVAKRHNGLIVEKKVHPLGLQDSASVRHDLFQFMIGNTDWSTAFMHNAKLIQLNETKKLVPLTFDFDMAGFVDAPYAEVNESLEIASVRDRLYRGFCRPNEFIQVIRKEYIENEQNILNALQRYKSNFEPKEFSGLVKYMEDFFSILKSDSKFKSQVTDKCRTK